MVKDPALLYGLTAAFGAASLSPLLLSLRQGGMPSDLVLPVFFLAILGAVFLVGGVCGVLSQYFKHKQNPFPGHHRKLFRVTAALGAAFLCTVLGIFLLGVYSEAASRFFYLIDPYGGLMIFYFLLGGTCLLTFGTSGIARQHFGSYKNLLTFLVAVLIPLLILMPIIYSWVSSITVGF